MAIRSFLFEASRPAGRHQGLQEALDSFRESTETLLSDSESVVQEGGRDHMHRF